MNRQISSLRTLGLLLALVGAARLAAAAEPANDAPPKVPGHHRLKFQAKVGDESFDLPYLLYLPADYDKNPAPHPVLIFLHGAGECGTDLNAIFIHGPAPAIEGNPKMKETFPFIGVYPQCIPGRRWDTPNQVAGVVQLLDYVLKTFRADPNRIYATGLSMGGKGTWLLAHQIPERLAAIAPISAIEVEVDKAVERFKRLPMWIICGGADGGFTEGSKKMAEVLKNSVPEPKLTVHDGEGHGVWTHYYPDQKFYDWFLTHQKEAPKPPPEVKAVVKAPPPVVEDVRPAHRAALAKFLTDTAGKRKEKLALNIFGSAKNVAVVGADATALKVEWSGNSLPLRWKDVEDPDLARVGLAYAANDADALFHVAALAKAAHADQAYEDAVMRLKQANTDQAKGKLAILDGKAPPPEQPAQAPAKTADAPAPETKGSQAKPPVQGEPAQVAEKKEPAKPETKPEPKPEPLQPAPAPQPVVQSPPPPQPVAEKPAPQPKYVNKTEQAAPEVVSVLYKAPQEKKAQPAKPAQKNAVAVKNAQPSEPSNNLVAPLAVKDSAAATSAVPATEKARAPAAQDQAASAFSGSNRYPAVSLLAAAVLLALALASLWAGASARHAHSKRSAS
ncbi:MAG: dienelactone hydrolase family protein [Planctomycetes bacterium]|nr:dienelactone hydrolase family protein [Planctomycetota bacterium]